MISQGVKTLGTSVERSGGVGEVGASWVLVELDVAVLVVVVVAGAAAVQDAYGVSNGQGPRIEQVVENAVVVGVVFVGLLWRFYCCWNWSRLKHLHLVCLHRIPCGNVTTAMTAGNLMMHRGFVVC